MKIDIDGAEMVSWRHPDRLCEEVGPILLLELHNPSDAEAWAFGMRTGYTLAPANHGVAIGQASQVGVTPSAFCRQLVGMWRGR
jgi:hypothetical protein